MGEARPMEEQTTEIVEMKIDDETTLAIRAVDLGGAADVGVLDSKALKTVTKAIEEVGEAISASIAKVAPNRASVEFGVEVAISAGKLVSLLTSVEGKATLTVTLEWGA
jgi:Trypsin-co-occurring domain 1